LLVAFDAAGQRGLGEPPLFPCVPVPSEYTQLTYHPGVRSLLHNTVEQGTDSRVVGKLDCSATYIEEKI
jgi:hypothetical protein